MMNEWAFALALLITFLTACLSGAIGRWRFFAALHSPANTPEYFWHRRNRWLFYYPFVIGGLVVSVWMMLNWWAAALTIVLVVVAYCLGSRAAYESVVKRQAGYLVDTEGLNRQDAMRQARRSIAVLLKHSSDE